MTSQQFLLVAIALGVIAVIAALFFARRTRGPSESIAAPPPVAAPPAHTEIEPSPSASPSPFLPAPEGEADDLSRIKGIGPKLSALLAELGVFHFTQIAGWTPEQLAIVNERLGNFAGRPERDQWQSQARLLASGDVKGYERAHGKIGPAA